MENTIMLNPNAPTDIAQYRGRIVSYLKLKLAGSGKINSCVISFYNQNDSPENSASLKLIQPDFTPAQTLVPYQGGCLLIMEYDYCRITDINGTLQNGDQMFVILNDAPLA